MFAPTSRYAAVEQTTLTAADGRVITHLRRRLRPRTADLPLQAEVTVAPGDRADTVAAHTLGDPELSWRLADANDVMRPSELTAEPGRVVRVPAPGS